MLVRFRELTSQAETDIKKKVALFSHERRTPTDRQQTLAHKRMHNPHAQREEEEEEVRLT